MKSLKTKLMVFISVMVAVLISLVGFFNYLTARKIMEEQIYVVAEESARQNAEVLDKWLAGLEDQMKSLSNTPAMQSMEWSLQAPLLKGALTAHRNFELMYVADRSGIMTSTANVQADISKRDYFIQAMQGKLSYSEPLPSGVSGRPVIVITQPIIPDGTSQPVGVLGATVSLDYVQELASSMKLAGYGNGWVIGDNTVTLGHPTSDFLGNTDIFELSSELTGIAEKMVAGVSGVTKYKLNGEDKLLAYTPVSRAGWSVAVGATVNDLLSSTKAIAGQSILIALLDIIIGLVAAYLIAVVIVKPILKVKTVAEGLADGDLTRKVKYESADEVGQMAKAVDTAIENLKALIGRVSETSQSVATSSGQLSAAAEEVGNATHQVTDTINQLAKGADEQAKSAQQTGSIVESMSASVRQVANSSQTMANDAESAVNTSKQGQDLVKQAIGQMKAVEESAKHTSEAMYALGNMSKEIGQIVEVITGIADQTNLLALNAAIEAARAGEQGRGFAVVAEEVRKLAEQSRQAAEQISSLIKDTQDETVKAVRASETGAKEIAAGTDVVERTGEVFNQISLAIQTVVAQIKEVTAATHHLSTDSEQVVKSVESVAATAQETAAGTEEISASAEEQNASVEEIAASSEALSEMAKELQTAISAFRM